MYKYTKNVTNNIEKAFSIAEHERINAKSITVPISRNKDTEDTEDNIWYIKASRITGVKDYSIYRKSVCSLSNIITSCIKLGQYSKDSIKIIYNKLRYEIDAVQLLIDKSIDALEFRCLNDINIILMKCLKDEYIRRLIHYYEIQGDSLP